MPSSLRALLQVFSYDCYGTKCQFSSACSKKKKKRRREEPFDDVTCLVVDRNRARRSTIEARTPFFETATKQRFQPLPAYSAVSFISQRDVLRISMTHKTFSKTEDRKETHHGVGKSDFASDLWRNLSLEVTKF